MEGTVAATASTAAVSRQDTVRRATKLGRVFGAPPPSDLVAATPTGLEAERRSLAALRQLIEEGTDVSELISYLDDDDADADDDSRSTEKLTLDPKDGLAKSMRQRKINKLRSFFGTGLDAAALWEQRVLRELEASFEERYVGAELERLREDLQDLREQVRRHSASGSVGVSGRSTGAVAEDDGQGTLLNHAKYLI